LLWFAGSDAGENSLKPLLKVRMPKRSSGRSLSSAWSSAARACSIDVPAIEPDTSIM
jgi:hypothetical protein